MLSCATQGGAPCKHQKCSMACASIAWRKLQPSSSHLCMQNHLKVQSVGFQQSLMLWMLSGPACPGCELVGEFHHWQHIIAASVRHASGWTTTSHHDCFSYETILADWCHPASYRHQRLSSDLALAAHVTANLEFLPNADSIHGPAHWPATVTWKLMQQAHGRANHHNIISGARCMAVM